MDTQLKVVSILLFALAGANAFLPHHFNWKTDLAPIKLLNRQIMYVHTFFIAFILILMGLLCLTSSNDLLTTVLGRRIAIGLAAFWIARLLIQLFGYSSRLWKGKRFETSVHVIASLLWLYFSIVFIVIACF